ncbi:MAG: amino acid transporter [Verrucomicrobia bacterium]|nr:MAG: amino acid transporter [Verrucomicrobiota bacterium]
MATTETETARGETKFVQGLGFVDSTMIVAGSMIGSGIFIVSAEITRQVGSGGWLLAVWAVTGLLTVVAALSYGELAAMMPEAGGQYVYLREAFGPMWGFLYGWTSFLVIQTGTIAAVGVAFASYLGVLAPDISSTAYLIKPIPLPFHLAVSLSWQQGVAIVLIVLLTFLNTQGLRLGKLIQNTFTSAKTLALIGLIFIGLFLGRNAEAIKANFSNFWTPQGVEPVESGSLLTAASGVFGLFIAFCVAQVGSLFSADAWNNITFTAGEVKNPRRNIPLSLACGTGLVIVLYLLANLAYLCILPLEKIQHAPDNRVAAAAIEVVFGSAGAVIMAVAIMVSTFGCNNGLILAGARLYYAMGRDGLFFKATSRLNSRNVPGVGLVLQCVWTCLLVLMRTQTGVKTYGNLYNNLLDYVVFAVLIFYVVTIAGIFVLRRKRPEAERPYRAFGYPVVPALYMIGASVIAVVLLFYKTQTAWPGLLIVLSGVPVFYLWRKKSH